MIIILRYSFRCFTFQSQIQNIWAMQHRKIIIQEAQACSNTACSKLRYFTVYTLLSVTRTVSSQNRI